MSAVEKNMQDQRRRRYVDHSLQGSLILGLVLLETLLFCGAMFYIYQAMHQAIEAQLYSAHPHGPSILQLLLVQLGRILPWLIVANLVAVWLANRLWARCLGRVIGRLTRLLERVGGLDLRLPREKAGGHEVCELGRRWLTLERERQLRLRAAFTALEQAEVGPPRRQALEEMRRLLPQAE